MFLDFKAELLDALQSYYHLTIQWMPKVALGLVILLAGWIVAAQISLFAQRKFNLKLEDPLLARFLARIVKYILLVIAFILTLRAMDLGDVAGGLLAGAGVSAFIIGFAFKDIGENFLAGILLAFQRPFKVGHTIESGSIKGNVVSMDLRNTQVKTFDGKDVFIPNSALIKNPLINYTIDGYLRQDFTIGVDYQTDINKAIKIILDTLTNVEGVLQEDKQPAVAISSLGASSLGLQAFYWLDTFDKTISGRLVKNEAIEKTLSALDEAGVYMPADLLEIKNYQSKRFQLASANQE